MSTLYVINLFSNSKGRHLVHKYGCPIFPDNFVELGLYDSCNQAVQIAEETIPNASCCPTCISDCKDPEHKRKHKLKTNMIFDLETE